MNENVFTNFITSHLSYCIASAEFSDELKRVNILIHREEKGRERKVMEFESSLIVIYYKFHFLVLLQSICAGGVSVVIVIDK